MNNFDDFIFKYRFYIGGILVLVILAGSGLLIYDRYHRAKLNSENREIADLRTQNEALRNQLSQQATKNVASASVENQSDKININTADATELDKLPGIGPAKAADIIAYRESKGGFQTIEELKEVKGIGDKTFENLKDLVTVGEE